MKRQLDRLKGKRLVTGDPNLMTKDEICINATPNGVEVKEIGTDGKIKDLAGSGNSGGGDSEEIEYYMFDIKTEENIDKIHTFIESHNNKLFMYFLNEIIFMRSHYEDGTSINKVGTGMYTKNVEEGSSITTIPIAFLNIINTKYYHDVYIENCTMRKLYDDFFKEQSNIEFDDMFIKITKEEYNNLRNSIA